MQDSDLKKRAKFQNEKLPSSPKIIIKNSEEHQPEIQIQTKNIPMPNEGTGEGSENPMSDRERIPQKTKKKNKIKNLPIPKKGSGESSENSMSEEERTPKKRQKNKKRKRKISSSSSSTSESSTSESSTSDSESSYERTRKRKSRKRKRRHAYSSSDSSEESDEELEKIKKNLKKPKKSKKPDVPNALIDYFKSLEGLDKADESSLVSKYSNLAELIKVPKADAELTVEMNWAAKDTSKIKNVEDVQSLYQTESSHPGLTSDMYSRFAYRDVVNTLLPIIHIKSIMENATELDGDTVLESINDCIKLGGNALNNINLDRRSRIWRRDPLNKELKDFYKNPNNYNPEEAKDFVFGAEFCTNRIKAFANIADEDNMRRVVTQAFKNKKAARRRHDYKKSYSKSYNKYDHGNSYDRRQGSSENSTPFKSSLKASTDSYDQHINELSSSNRYEINEHIYNTIKNLNLPDSNIPLFDNMKFFNIPYIGGRTNQFLDNWNLVTSDPFILDIIKGHKIPLKNKPVDILKPTLENNMTLNCIAKNLENRVIEISNEKGSISPIFFKSKADGSARMILNLKNLNEDITYTHFKMCTFNDARNIVDKNDYMITIDLKSAYDCLLIHKESRGMLQFRAFNKTFNYRGFPNGYCEAPRIFTKITKPIMRILYKLSIKAVIYIDDFLIACHDRDLLLEHASITIKLLIFLGFIINEGKSQLNPSRVINFLGYKINSESMTFHLTEEKLKKISKLCTRMENQRCTSAKNLAEITGILQFAIKVIPMGNLHYRNMQKQIKIATEKGDWSSKITLNKESKEELRWWIINIKKQNQNYIRSPPINIIIKTDASKLGWGGTYLNLKTRKKLKAQGPWTKKQSLSHINLLEMLAALNVLKSVAQNTQGMSIKLMMDNTTAISIIKKMGSSKSNKLNKIAIEIWEWAKFRENTITPCFLPGKINTQADKLSRIMMKDSSDWKLNPIIFRKINTTLGPLKIDLFANMWNTQLKDYYALNPQPAALAIDAMVQTWPKTRGYAFPPITLIPAVLNKIVQDQIEHIVLITPIWPQQPWYGKLLQMITRNPILIPNSEILLMNAKELPHPLLKQKTFRLAAWSLSGVHTLIKDSQLRLQKSWPIYTEKPHKNLMTAPGANGLAGVMKNQSIEFIPL